MTHKISKSIQVLSFYIATVFLMSASLQDVLATAQTERGKQGNVGSGDWCATQSMYDAKVRAAGGGALFGQHCPTAGPCDDPTIRDSFTPDSLSDFKIIRLYFHVLREDDGSNAAASANDVDIQMVALNAYFAPYRIEFDYQTRFVNSTAFRFVSSFAEADQMKDAYALMPDSQLNIFVCTMSDPSFGPVSFGVLPWDIDALRVRGGIVMNRFSFVPFDDVILTHEMGHNLGLMHTHRGVDGVTQCGECYEQAQTLEGNFTGDLCQDTPPTPTNAGNCGNPGGNDPCSSLPWGTTDFRNYMGYAPSSCYTHFTDQQAGRMHCWTDAELFSLLINVRLDADDIFGSPPHTVNFMASSPKTVTAWNWDFGDSTFANIQHPSHVYNQPGAYTVSLNVQTPDGSDYTTIKNNFVFVVAETLMIANIEASASQTVRVDVSINNHVPLTEVTLPISYNGPFGLLFDSVSTAGLRTSYLTVANNGIFELNNDVSNKRFIRKLLPSASQPIQPGSGPILSLYFRTPSMQVLGVNPIEFVCYGFEDPSLTVEPGEFFPETVNGSMIMNCCAGNVGNTDGDIFDLVDVRDLVALINTLFITFDELDCPLEANADGDPEGLVDVRDLVALINSLFITFDPLPSCP